MNSELLHKAEKVIAPLPYTSRIFTNPKDGTRRAVMTTHTALVTDGAIGLAMSEDYKDAPIIIPGEDTLGPSFPSTSDLMKAQMVRKGIAAERIITVGGVNDTETQLKAIRDLGVTNPHIVALDFHMGRAGILSDQLDMNSKLHRAEELVLRRHKGATPERIKKIVDTKSKVFGRPAIYMFEGIARTATRLGRPGKAALKVLRKITGSDGPTVTDYHDLTSAKAYLKKAVKNETDHLSSQI